MVSCFLLRGLEPVSQWLFNKRATSIRASPSLTYVFPCMSICGWTHLFCFFETGSQLCRSGWPRTHGELLTPASRVKIKGVHHHTRFTFVLFKTAVLSIIFSESHPIGIGFSLLHIKIYSTKKWNRLFLYLLTSDILILLAWNLITVHASSFLICVFMYVHLWVDMHMCAHVKGQSWY